MLRQSLAATLAVLALASVGSIASAAGGARPVETGREGKEKAKEEEKGVKSAPERTSENQHAVADARAQRMAADNVAIAKEALAAAKANRGATEAELKSAQDVVELTEAIETAYKERAVNGLAEAKLTKDARAIKMIHDLMKQGMTISAAVEKTVKDLGIDKEKALECGGKKA